MPLDDAVFFPRAIDTAAARVAHAKSRRSARAVTYTYYLHFPRASGVSYFYRGGDTLYIEDAETRLAQRGLLLSTPRSRELRSSR